MAKKAMINKNNKKIAQGKTIQVRNRCNQCGRPRGYMRAFGICRVCFIKLANEGKLPGVKQGSR